MSNPFNKWKRQFDAQIKSSIKASEKTIRAAAITVGNAIIGITPVDLGTLQANWKAEVNNAPSGTTNSTNKAEATSSMVSGTINYKIKDTIYIANNMPYAKRINDGYSKQAPTFFVQKEARKFDRYIKQIAKKNEVK